MHAGVHHCKPRFQNFLKWGGLFSQAVWIFKDIFVFWFGAQTYTDSKLTYVLKTDFIVMSAGERPYVCQDCNATFVNKGVLIVHMRKHTGERPFVCPHCESAYAQKSNLKAHLRSHTGEKPYKCKHCETCFTTSSSLTRHIRLHTGEKPYKCFAMKPALQPCPLTRHIRQHTGEKPCNCKHCETCFTTSSSLTRHIRLHTGEKP